MEAAAYSPLLTDLYQLTMAHGYWKRGMDEREAVFCLSFRKNPFGGGYAVACGLADALDFLEQFRFRDDEIAYLAGLRGNDRGPLFDGGFLDYLRRLILRCEIDSVPEGTVVFAGAPFLRVRGPLLQGQLVETALLAILNYQTLVATKAARMSFAAGGDDVVEFGLRRAQGVNGGMAGTRAAYVGGCAGTSHVLAGMRHGIPVRGTHAHSWVMAFDSESAAFDAYAAASPNNGILLVDTYDTLRGVGHAIDTARKLREQGHELVGIRLDSGDLAHLSIEARRRLDEAGFPGVRIVATNELDEYAIEELKARGARIDTWGIGTRLITAYDQPALGGVYKLTALRRDDGSWHRALKLSEEPAKASCPGILQVRRFLVNGRPAGDVIYDEVLTPRPERTMILPATASPWSPPGDAEAVDLLAPVFRAGRRVAESPPLQDVRAHAAAQLAALGPDIRRLRNPEIYPVGLEPALHGLLRELSPARDTAGDSPATMPP